MPQISIADAETLAFDPLHAHSSASLEDAAAVLNARKASGRDEACYAQLATLKARLQRIKSWTGLHAGTAPDTALAMIAHLIDGK